VDTKRPNGGSHSMPSGHTSISFSSAEFLRKRYGWERRLPAYGVDSWVAYSRVGSDQHQPLDVLMGAGIGILSRYLFTKPYQSWNVAITADGRSMGLQVSRNW
jgi:membrane-associated phospholipid phosphatase